MRKSTNIAQIRKVLNKEQCSEGGICTVEIFTGNDWNITRNIENAVPNDGTGVTFQFAAKELYFLDNEIHDREEKQMPPGLYLLLQNLPDMLKLEIQNWIEECGNCCDIMDGISCCVSRKR